MTSKTINQKIDDDSIWRGIFQRDVLRWGTTSKDFGVIDGSSNAINPSNVILQQNEQQLHLYKKAVMQHFISNKPPLSQSNPLPSYKSGDNDNKMTPERQVFNIDDVPGINRAKRKASVYQRDRGSFSCSCGSKKVDDPEGLNIVDGALASRKRTQSRSVNSLSSDSAGIPILKIVFLGDSNVGKTCMVERYVSGRFLGPNLPNTIGVAFCTKYHQERGVKLEIWDTAGQERFRSLGPIYYRRAKAAIVVYDISNMKSFEIAKDYATEIINRHGEDECVVQLVGNKVDLSASSRAVPFDVASKWALDKHISLKVIETSALTGENIDHVFDVLTNHLS